MLVDVVEARCKRTGARVALKVYSLPDMTPLTRVQLLREMRLHLQLVRRGRGGSGGANEEGWQGQRAGVGV